MKGETDRHNRLYRMADLTKEENGIKNRIETPAEWPQERFCPQKAPAGAFFSQTEEHGQAGAGIEIMPCRAVLSMPRHTQCTMAQRADRVRRCYPLMAASVFLQ